MKTLTTFLALTLVCGLTQTSFAQDEAPAVEAPAAEAAEEAVPQLSPAPEDAAPIPEAAPMGDGHAPAWGPGHGCSTCGQPVIYSQAPCCQPMYYNCCRPRRSNPFKKAWDGLCNLEKQKNNWLKKTFLGHGRKQNCCPQPVYYYAPQPCCGN